MVHPTTAAACILLSQASTSPSVQQPCHVCGAGPGLRGRPEILCTSPQGLVNPWSPALLPSRRIWVILYSLQTLHHPSLVDPGPQAPHFLCPRSRHPRRLETHSRGEFPHLITVTPHFLPPPQSPLIRGPSTLNQALQLHPYPWQYPAGLRGQRAGAGQRQEE